jgi:hypothetical protein
MASLDANIGSGTVELVTPPRYTQQRRSIAILNDFLA